MTEAYVNIRVTDGVETIEFFHSSSNSLPAIMLRQLMESINEAAVDPDVKVIVLRSGGEKAFCAGASFDELVAIQNEEEGLDFFTGFAKVINAIRTCPKFIIGRIHGKCVGGGVGLAAAVDYAIASAEADIKLSELAVGIGPFVVGPAVERKMGLSAFSALAIDASSWRSSAWAAQHGLFAELHPNRQAMDEAIKKLCNTLTHSSPEAMAEIKKIAWRGTEDWDTLLMQRAAISGRLVLSEFTREAIAKFKSAAKG
ncbi:MAG: enoyl-CoA hydratase/isomerase family protein [Chitinophagaceae bacterium]|nr:enoyl-CoA hydratase/isomerase family protein [Chitinophagaceae bacterium]MBL0335694.1 enoyl-CoA hydratase/isomerase family protein [Chitinophagaceae bacterium]